MSTLTVTQTEDYRDGVPAIPPNVTNIVFSGGAASTATFSSTQFGNNPITDTVTITQDTFANTIRVFLPMAGVFSAAGWSYFDFV
jgi:hypothetical protein